MKKKNAGKLQHIGVKNQDRQKEETIMGTKVKIKDIKDKKTSEDTEKVKGGVKTDSIAIGKKMLGRKGFTPEPDPGRKPYSVG